MINFEPSHFEFEHMCNKQKNVSFPCKHLISYSKNTNHDFNFF